MRAVRRHHGRFPARDRLFRERTARPVCPIPACPLQAADLCPRRAVPARLCLTWPFPCPAACARAASHDGPGAAVGRLFAVRTVTPLPPGTFLPALRTFSRGPAPGATATRLHRPFGTAAVCTRLSCRFCSSPLPRPAKLRQLRGVPPGARAARSGRRAREGKQSAKIVFRLFPVCRRPSVAASFCKGGMMDIEETSGRPVPSATVLSENILQRYIRRHHPFSREAEQPDIRRTAEPASPFHP